MPDRNASSRAAVKLATCSRRSLLLAQLRQEVETLREQVAKLTAALEERRRGQTPSGAILERTAGHGTEAARTQDGQATWSARASQRAAADRRDLRRTVAAECPHCGEQQSQRNDVAVQYQTEIPRTVIYRRFDVHIGRAKTVAARSQGRHALQTSSARGAAASQLGSNVHALLALLNKEWGLSHGKSVRLLRTLFPELRIARATSVRSILRTWPSVVLPAYEQLRNEVRGAAEVAPTKRAGAWVDDWPGCTRSSVAAKPVT